MKLDAYVKPCGKLEIILTLILLATLSVHKANAQVDVATQIMREFQAMGTHGLICLQAVEQNSPVTLEMCQPYRQMWDNVHNKYGTILIHHVMQINGKLDAYWAMQSIYIMWLH